MLNAKRESQVTFLHAGELDRIPRIVHAFSTRRAERADFSLGPPTSPNPMIQMNRARFLAAIGAPGWPILKLKQVHSGIVREMDDTSAANEAQEGDAAITSLPGALLGILTADCVPVLIADTKARCVAAIHAGWQGIAARIAEKAVQRLEDKYGIDPRHDLCAVIGPHIGVCCYEVGEDVFQAVGDSTLFERRAEWPKPHFNLLEANRRQLLGSGLPLESIVTSSLCTRCRADLFFSYRGEGENTGRLFSVIGIAP